MVFSWILCSHFSMFQSELIISLNFASYIFINLVPLPLPSFNGFCLDSYCLFNCFLLGFSALCPSGARVEAKKKCKPTLILFHWKFSSCLTIDFSRLIPDHTLHFFFFFLFMAVSVTYGSSWARGLNWSCSCWPTPQPQQRWIWAASATYTIACSNAGSFNPLSKARDWTCFLMDTSWVLNPLSPSRNSTVNFSTWVCFCSVDKFSCILFLHSTHKW